MAEPRIYRYAYANIEITCIVCGDFKENAYLLRNKATNQQLLIDPGDNLDVIRKEIGSTNRLANIILTHGHFDHVGAAAALCREFELKLNIHKNDVRLLRRASTYALSFTKRSIETPKEYLTFEYSEQFSLNDLTIMVFACPGHTAGGVCFYIDGVLFTGDSLFFQHIGPTDYPESSYSDLIESIDRLLAKFTDDTIIMPGHGRPWTVGEARPWWAINRSAPPQFQIMHR